MSAAVLGMYSATGRAPEAHTGQHLQGCVTCYAYAAAAAEGLRVPSVGDRVVVDATILGELYAVQVVVAQIDVDPVSRKLRVIGRPEGTLVTAFSATRWREVVA